MKRNEEYVGNEKICSSLFLLTYCFGEEYRLIKRLKFREEMPGTDRWFQKWSVLKSDRDIRTIDLWVEEHEPFLGEDFVR